MPIVGIPTSAVMRASDFARHSLENQHDGTSGLEGMRVVEQLVDRRG